MLKSTTVVLIFVTLSIVHVDGDLKVAAFNIQIFGKAKVENKAAFETIIKVSIYYKLVRSFLLMKLDIMKCCLLEYLFNIVVFTKCFKFTAVIYLEADWTLFLG